MRTDLRLLKKLLLSNNAGLMLERFDERGRALERRIRKARRKPSEKAVHDLRVAARRMLAMCSLLETTVAPKRTSKLRRKLGKGIGRLRRIRDVQVQIRSTEQLLDSFPQLVGFHRSLLADERRRKGSVIKQLGRVDLGGLRRETDRLIDRLVASLDPERDRALGDQIAASIEDAFRQVCALRTRIRPERPATIHRMRLAFKEFRYRAELASPLFGQFTEDRLLAMHDYQTRMGEIQDIESMLSTMKKYRRRSGRTSILVVENEIRHQRRRLIEAFLETADELRFFWSPPPIESREVV